MLTVKPNYYHNFKCLMGECPSSCCIMWQVVVDDKSLDYYNSLNTPYGEYIRSKITDIQGEPCFKVENGRCAFLNENNLCNMYMNIGQENGAETCRTFPDFKFVGQDIQLLGKSASCPFVARKILEEEPELHLQGECENPLEKEVLDLWFLIRNELKAKTEQGSFDILSYVKDYQESICGSFGIEEPFVPLDYKGIEDFLGTLSSLSVLTEEWAEILDELQSFQWSVEENMKFSDFVAMENREKSFDNILLYFIYRYMMDYISQGNLVLPVKFALISTRIIYSICLVAYCKTGELTLEQQARYFYLYSKEVEHNNENLEIFFEDASLGLI